MASYATRDDIDTIYPKMLERVAYDRAAGAVDDQLVNVALDAATAEIDMFLAQRYPLPLRPIPGMVLQFAIDIALYRMSLTREKQTTEMRVRYDDTIARLTMLAAGKIGLGNVALDPTTGTATVSGGSDANFSHAQFCLMRRQG